jgi:hypothetical protein
MIELKWDFYEGSWDAISQMMADDLQLQWTINVMEDGTFDVNSADSELQSSSVKIPTFATLAAAKKHCQDCENELIADAAMWARIDGGKVER